MAPQRVRSVSPQHRDSVSLLHEISCSAWLCTTTASRRRKAGNGAVLERPFRWGTTFACPTRFHCCRSYPSRFPGRPGRSTRTPSSTARRRQARTCQSCGTLLRISSSELDRITRPTSLRRWNPADPNRRATRTLGSASRRPSAAGFSKPSVNEPATRRLHLRSITPGIPPRRIGPSSVGCDDGKKGAFDAGMVSHRGEYPSLKPRQAFGSGGPLWCARRLCGSRETFCGFDRRRAGSRQRGGQLAIARTERAPSPRPLRWRGYRR